MGSEDAPTAVPGDYGIDGGYVVADGLAANILANLRAVLRTTGLAYSSALLGAANAETQAEYERCEARAQRLSALLKTTRSSAAQAEAKYAQWLASKSKLKLETHDFRLPIDSFPSRSGLHNWALASSRSTHEPEWTALVDKLSIAVSIDLDEIAGNQNQSHNE